MRFICSICLSATIFLSVMASFSATASPLFQAVQAGYYQHLFRIDGSNTIGAELAPALVKAWLAKHGANQISVVDIAENEVRVVAFLPDRNAQVTVDIAAHGSGTGFSALAQETTDIAAAARPVKPKEQSLFKAVDLTNVDSEHIVGIDGLAIIVHPSNPLRSLSVANLRRVFSGDVHNWSQLGGNDEAINVFARDENSGTWDSFRHMVLGKMPLIDNAMRYESNNDLSDTVSQVQGAIGFVGLASVRDAKLMAISDGNVGALQPNKLTVATEDYALARRLYMYTAGKPTNAYVDDFLYFVANEGQKQVSDVGFISQEVQPVFPEYLSALPKPMQGLVNNAYRLSLNFRFNNGSAKFDNKAQRDVDRLLEFMSEHPDAELMLFGFASESDDAEMTMLLSKHRAMAVSRALRRAAIYPDVVRGFGSQAPVAAVEDNDGRQKNSRVEVWIRPPQAYAEVY